MRMAAPVSHLSFTQCATISHINKNKVKNMHKILDSFCALCYNMDKGGML